VTHELCQLVPTINGYKRLVGGEAFWAPNAVTYGYDSRAASVRVISPPSVPSAATRFEIRVTGADVNPFFALSAIFGLGIRGIEKKLKLPVPPISHFSLEDKKAGKVCLSPPRLAYLINVMTDRYPCYRNRWTQRQRGCFDLIALHVRSSVMNLWIISVVRESTKSNFGTKRSRTGKVSLTLSTSYTRRLIRNQWSATWSLRRPRLPVIVIVDQQSVS
jgi:Glutamine synthetase, catalytic domain